MAVEIQMPKLGKTMEDGRLIEWRKAEKDAVRKGEIICDIESDKVTFEVESPGDGLLHILLADGEAIAVGTILGYLAESEIEYDKLAGKVRQPILKAMDSNVEIHRDEPALIAGMENSFDNKVDKVRASPAARDMARHCEIDLATLVGTGPAGRIIKRDVQLAVVNAKNRLDGAGPALIRATPGARRLAKQLGVQIESIHGTGPNARITRADVTKFTAASPHGTTTETDSNLERYGGRTLLREESMTGIRGTIAKRMKESLHHAAQITAFTEWDLTELMRLRHALNEQMDGQTAKVSILGLMVLFLAQALKEFPVFNSSISDKKIRYWADANIGVAVAIDDALVVPVIHQAQKKSLKEIQSLLMDLIARARSKRLLPDDMAGGTFTLSNVGSYGSDWETVILNPPEVGLLGIGLIAEKPVVLDGEIIIRKRMPVSLTFDHRLIDGATAGAFRNRLKTLVETPGLMISTINSERYAPIGKNHR
jgi:pyruvate dehydrogenase E2 component (dihydrolipoamide acetyltransferase)